MPRVHANSSLRNRNRVTNKTRLKIIHGNIEADPLIYGEDDTPTGALFLNTHGVDAEDANEHHLQAVLSAASQRNQCSSQRSTRGATEKSNVSAVFIPVPDSTGIVDNYAELYPPARWTDPATYTRSSETVEESCSSALANGFTYYMDERDKEWLDKNNEEARGEGTSAQGAFSTAGTTTRSGPARSAKAKGKEPDVAQPVPISEDEFELVTGLFEKATHEKTEFLHHSLETGMAFPAFTEYQDVFTSLSPTTFAAFKLPAWFTPSTSTNLPRIARVVYPYWKERRIERGGLRIIPTLNGDETDTLNESYICFRRREIKAIRKTRASQITSSDKLVRLQSELLQSMELAKCVLVRELLKKDCAQQAQNVWEKRLNFVELKRKLPTLGDKADEELLHDKERVPKVPLKGDSLSRLPGLKLRTRDSDLNSPSLETSIRPKERRAMIQTQIERELLLQKERDHQWEDQIDNAYQQLPIPYPSRLYKFIPPPEARPASSFHDVSRPVQARSVRLRFGRGGRLLVDRRNLNVRSPSSYKRSEEGIKFSSLPQSRKHGRTDDDEDEERDRRARERWRFDVDDCPAAGPEGSDEQDRVLVDDYDPKYLRHTMSLLHDSDLINLTTDPSIIVQSADGRQQSVIPFKSSQQLIMRTNRSYPSGNHPPPSVVAQPATTPLPVPLAGTPVSVTTPIKRMQPPASVPQMRISSNGGMRPTGLVAPSISSNGPRSSPPHGAAPSINGINGVHRSVPQHEVPKTETITNPPIPNGVSQNQTELHPAADTNGVGQGISPARPKSQNQHHMNGYHLTAINGYPGISNGAPYLHANQHNQHNGLSMQQIQNLKSTFAIPPGQDVSPMQPNGTRQITGTYMVPNGAGFDMQLGAGGNMMLKLPPSRQMQWGTAPLQRSAAVNGVDSAMNGSMSPSPVHTLSAIGPPARTPSANGSRNGLRGVPTSISHGIGSGSHPMSPHLQQSPPSHALSLAQGQNQPSPRLPQTPTMTMVSPSLQHQQPVATSQGGY